MITTVNASIMLKKVINTVLFSFVLILLSAQDDVTFGVTHSTSSQGNGSIELTVQGVDASSLSFVWKDPLGNLILPQSQNIFNLLPGQYCVTIEIEPGCSAQGCATVLDCSSPSANCPSANFDWEFGYDACDVLFYDESSGSIASYLWNFGDGATSTESEPDHTYNYSGCYDVSLTITDFDGIVNTEIQQVCTVCGDSDELGCIITGPTIITAGETIQLNSVVSNPNGPSSYQWDGPFSSLVTYGNLSGPGPHTISFDENISDGSTYYFNLTIDGEVTCSHMVTISGSIPEVDVAVFGEEDDNNDSYLLNGYMIFVAFVNTFDLVLPEEYRFTFTGVNHDFFQQSPWQNGDYDFNEITFDTDGIYEVCVEVKDQVGTYQDCEEFTVGTGIGPPPDPDFNFCTIESITSGTCGPGSTPLALPQCGNVNFTVVAGDINVSEDALVHYYSKEEGSDDWTYLASGLLNVDGQITSSPVVSLLDDPILSGYNIGDCIPLKACMCPAEGFESFEDCVNPSGATNLTVNNPAYLHEYNEECVLFVSESPLRVDNVSLQEYSEYNECGYYIQIDASCGTPTAPYVPTNEYGSLCFDENLTYTYDWRVFSTSHPYEELIDFFIPLYHPNLTKCRMINMEHSYFDQFGPFDQIEFQVQARAIDGNHISAQEEQIFSIYQPLRINLPTEISRCPETPSLISYNTDVPIASGGSGNFSYQWTGDINTLSNTTTANPTILGLPDDGAIQNYTLTVTDLDLGCSVSSSVALTVTPLNLDLFDEIINCSNNSVVKLGPDNLDGLGGSGNYSFYWTSYYFATINVDVEVEFDITSYLSDPNSANPLLTLPPYPSDILDGMYYRLTVVDQEGGCSISGTMKAQTSGNTAQDLIADAGPDQTICFGDRAFIGTEANGMFEYPNSQNNGGQDTPDLLLTWTSNNSFFETGSDPLQELSPDLNRHPGTYTYTLTVENQEEGCVTTDEVEVTVLDSWKYSGYESEVYVIQDGQVGPDRLAWDNNNNKIFQSSSSAPNHSNYDAQSGAQLPFTYDWIPSSSGVQNVETTGNNNVPIQATLPDQMAEQYKLVVTDYTGCTNEFKTNQYISHSGEPVLSLWTSQPSEEECQEGIDICVEIQLKMNYGSGTTLPQFIYVNTQLTNPVNGAEGWEVVSLYLSNSDEQLYTGERCISTIHNNDESSFSFSVRTLLENQPYFPRQGFSIYDYGLGDIDFFIFDQIYAPEVCKICASDVANSSALNVIKAVRLYLQNYDGGTNAVCQPDVVECNPNVDLIINSGSRTFLGGEYVAIKGEVQFVPQSIGGPQEFLITIDPCLTSESQLIEDPPSALVKKEDDKAIVVKRSVDSLSLKSVSAKKMRSTLEVRPNPFTNILTIRYAIDEDHPVETTLAIRNITSQLQSTIVNRSVKEKGEYFEVFDSEGLPPGVYFVELSLDGKRLIKKVIKIDTK